MSGPNVPIRRVPAGTRFRFGPELQSAAIHGTVEGPGKEGGIRVHIDPRRDHKKLVDGGRGPGHDEEWSGETWVEAEG